MKAGTVIFVYDGTGGGGQAGFGDGSAGSVFFGDAAGGFGLLMAFGAIAIQIAGRFSAAVHRLADGLQELSLGVGVRRMRTQREGEDGIELAKFGNECLRPRPEILPRLLEGLLLAVLERSHDVEAGEILKLLEIHFFAFVLIVWGGPYQGSP